RRIERLHWRCGIEVRAAQSWADAVSSTTAPIRPGRPPTSRPRKGCEGAAPARAECSAPRHSETQAQAGGISANRLWTTRPCRKPRCKLTEVEIQFTVSGTERVGNSSQER